MKKAASLVICILLWSRLLASQDSTDVTQVGQMVPVFSVKTLDGKDIAVRDLRGKVVLLNFFATWCPPCKQEMPVLEKEIWQKYRDKDFLVLSIGREHTAEELLPFQKEYGLSFSMAPDPERKIFGLFATQFIPRNVLLDRTGKIVFQEKGYSEELFARLKDRIRTLLE